MSDDFTSLVTLRGAFRQARTPAGVGYAHIVERTLEKRVAEQLAAEMCEFCGPRAYVIVAPDTSRLNGVLRQLRHAFDAPDVIDRVQIDDIGTVQPTWTQPLRATIGGQAFEVWLLANSTSLESVALLPAALCGPVTLIYIDMQRVTRDMRQYAESATAVQRNRTIFIDSGTPGLLLEPEPVPESPPWPADLPALVEDTSGPAAPSVDIEMIDTEDRDC